MANGAALLESEVRELIRRRGLDPAVDETDLRALIADAVADYEDRSLRGLVPRLDDLDQTSKHLHDAISGLGPLQRYLEDPEVQEIWINDPERAMCPQPEATNLLIYQDIWRLDRPQSASGSVLRRVQIFPRT